MDLISQRTKEVLRSAKNSGRNGGRPSNSIDTVNSVIGNRAIKQYKNLVSRI